MLAAAIGLGIQRAAGAVTVVSRDLYYGGDSYLALFDHCTQFIAGRRSVAQQRFWSRPDINPIEFVCRAPDVVLAAYA